MKRILTMVIVLTLTATVMIAQTYTQLWKQVQQASSDDLPRTEQKVLQQIIKKATREKAYGQLLKATLKDASLLAEVAPDSLKPAVDRIALCERNTSDLALKSVYCAVLAKLYNENRSLSDDASDIAADYSKRAMEYPEVIAAIKTDSYTPFVIEQADSKLFGNDLLSIIATEVGDFEGMHRYYMAHGTRTQQLISGLQLITSQASTEYTPLNKNHTIHLLDSLIQQYEDLTECGEAAVKRYSCMGAHTDATVEQKVKYINLALSKWGSWKGMNYLRNQYKMLTAPLFEAAIEERVSIPEKQQTISLHNMRALQAVTMRLYKVDCKGDIQTSPNSADGYKKLKPLLTLMPQHTVTKQFVGHQPWQQFTDSILLPPLPVGVYMVEMQSQPQTETCRRLYFVSNCRVIQQDLPDKKIRYAVVNATTGQPIEGATLRLRTRQGYRQEEKRTLLKTDKNGECLHTYTDNRRPYEAYAWTADDTACPPTNQYGMFSYYDDERTRTDAGIFTDRAIYRPGQTVQVAAILYNTFNRTEHSALSGKRLSVTLRDANYKEIGKEQLTTDDYGTAHTAFVLPTTGLTGLFSLQINSDDNKIRTSTSIRVEEYKRPTFKVSFPEVNEDYSDGDTVMVKATAATFAGVPVQGAKVKYKVERRLPFWFWSYSRYWNHGLLAEMERQTVIAEGEALTDNNGQFIVEMPMILPKTKEPMFCNFVAIADVTDQAGETRTGMLTLPLGNRKTQLTIDIQEKLLAERPTKAVFHLRNAAGNEIESRVRYRIDGSAWKETATNLATDIVGKKLKSGKHTIEAVCDNDSVKTSFVLFSLDDTTPPTETDDWFYLSDTQFADSKQPVTLQIGSSDRDLHIIYNIISGSRIIESGTIKESQSLYNRKFTYKEEYATGLLITFAWMKDGRFHHHEATIMQPVPDTKLRLKWATFRDRLTPGQQEQWKLSIALPDGKPANAAQLMAVLYDKSLDEIARHQWDLSPAAILPLPSTGWSSGAWGGISLYGHRYPSLLNTEELMFSHFDESVFPTRASLFRMYKPTNVGATPGSGRKPRATRAEAPVMMAYDAAGVEEAQMEVMSAKMTADEAVDDTEQTEAIGTDMVRENLQETAFFYPTLTTDAEGNATIDFTLPESLTTWRFMGIAHTKDMLHGYVESEAIAQKDVMIQPNMPRFIRQDDEATITAKIINLSDKPLVGTAHMQLVNAETEQVVYDRKQTVSLPADTTVSATFIVDAKDRLLRKESLVVCRIVVSGNGFSDGEQHYLPILPSRERVTVTVPFTQNAPGTKEISLQDIIPASAADTKLTIEYTNNPAWLMIQALPTIAQPIDQNAISQAASLYANSLSSHILAENPSTRQIFELWKQESGSETTLMSTLEKNQELKDLVLSETPWVADADREATQKRLVSQLFDKNTIGLRKSNAIQKLTQLQNSDGSWSWWPGMDGSLYMTVEISKMLVRLNEMTSAQDETKSMLSNAFSYMGKEYADIVAEMKKAERRGNKQAFPSITALEWLYLCKIDGRQLPSNVKQANDYLIALLKKDRKNQTIYEKALSAIVLDQKNYVQSLKEYTVYREDVGRYYDTPRASYSWRDYRIPTQVAAIEALQRLAPADTATITEMQRWLLQEKRTTCWDTPINSVDAIYAFLNQRQGQLFRPQEHTILKIDSQQLDLPKATAGVGYVKTSVDGEGKKSFTAEKSSEGTSWGAVYAQFTQSIADIDSHDSGISVKRELIDAATGKPIDTPVAIGTRVKARITITADRDYDFVQVEDKRAACLEPASQLSGYHWGYYIAPKDNATYYYFSMLSKGKHVVESDYFVDRAGTYQAGTCTAQCAYAPEFRGNSKHLSITAK